MSKNITSSKKLVACIQVRALSKRIKTKALQTIRGETILEHCYKRLNKIVSNKYPIFILTSDHKSDESIIKLCKEKKYKYFVGSKNNVIKRYYDFIGFKKYKNVLRATCDNIFLDINSCKITIKKHLKNKLDYSTNHYSGLAKGSGVDIFNSETIKKINLKAKNKIEKEHINKIILDNKKDFKTFFYKSKKKTKINLSIDTYKDLNKIKKKFNHFSKYGFPNP